MQLFPDMLFNKIIQLHPISETDFHFRRMHVHIYIFGINGKMQCRKGKFVLHHIFPVSFFYSFSDYAAFNKSPVYKIYFKVPVRPVNFRLSQKPPHMDALFFYVNRN